MHDPDYGGNSLGSAVYVGGAGRAVSLDLPLEHRVWFAADRVEFPGRPSFVAVSVHTPTVPSVRPFVDRAFESLAPLLANESFIVGGDFNLSRNYHKVYGTSHHTEFLDGLQDRGFVDCMREAFGEEQQTFWGRSKHAYQNDHVFVSRDLASAVVSCDVADRAGLSDHSPLRLALEIGASG